MKTLIVAALLVAPLWPAAAAPQKRPAKETLSLGAAALSAKYAEGAPLPVTLTFRNTGRKRTTLVFLKSDYEPPVHVQARVWDREGRLLTLNDTLEDGWWTVWTGSSGSLRDAEKGKADRVPLKPGEEYARTVDLAQVLAGCRCQIPDGLKAGVYRVQFSYGSVFSNEVEISIGN